MSEAFVSQVQCEILIEHLDGRRVAVKMPQGFIEMRRFNAVRGLVRRSLLKWDRQIRPTYTTITEPGRRKLASVLANYADALLQITNSEMLPSSGGNDTLYLETIKCALRDLALNAKAKTADPSHI
jgi:hypothetical protein